MNPKPCQWLRRQTTPRATLLRRGLESATETPSWRRLVEVERLAAEGLPDDVIATKLGICTIHAGALRRRLGISSARTRAIRGERGEALLKRLEAFQSGSGTKWRTLANECGLTTQTLRNWRSGSIHPSPRKLNAVERFFSDKGG